MKRLLILLDAAADLPYAELEDRTPLEQALMPHARTLAAEGRAGGLRIRQALPDASRALLAQACGYAPREAISLRWGPIGAAAAGHPVSGNRFYLLCHLISMDGEGVHDPVSPSSVGEQDELLGAMQTALREAGESDARLISLSPGRFVMELARGELRERAAGASYDHAHVLRRAPERLRRAMRVMERRLARHPVNAVRLDLGEPAIHGAWCWSGGSRLPSRRTRSGSQILLSPDPLARGLAEACGIPFRELPDPFRETSDPAGARSALAAALGSADEAVVWIPAPFASVRFEGAAEKVRRLDTVDYRLIGPARDVADTEPGVRLLIAAAGVRHRGIPVRGLAPFILWGAGVAPDGARSWSEPAAASGSLGTPRPDGLLKLFRTST